MTSSKLLTELETSNTPMAAFVGSVSGILLILAPATVVIVLLNKWSHWVGLVLSLFVLLGTISTAIEALSAFRVQLELKALYSVNSLRYFISIKVIQALLFGSSLAILCNFIF